MLNRENEMLKRLMGVFKVTRLHSLILCLKFNVIPENQPFIIGWAIF